MDKLSNFRPTSRSKMIGISLEVPDVHLSSRRSSPRAEELMKNRAIKKHDATRQRLGLHKGFDDAVSLLIQSRNIVVLSGAGISTSVGIPDFRSDKGLYKTLSEELSITEPEEFFSNPFFAENPLQFFKYVRGVLPKAIPCTDGSYRHVNPKIAAKDSNTFVPKYSPTHAFLTLLQSKNKLLTNYTQNIDGLEVAAGLDHKNFIQCHGSWDSATCMTCGKSVSAKKYLPIAFTGGVPFCKCSMEETVAIPKPKKKKKKKKSKAKSQTTSGKKRKRAQAEEDYGSDHSSDQYDYPSVPRGLLKPDITFFEDPITTDYKTRLKSDKSNVDLLIVVGTSLKVAPIQQMLYQIPPNVPQIYISKERFSGALCSLPGVQVDIELLGESDIIIEELCRRAGWTDDLNKHLWEPDLTKIKGYTVTDLSAQDETIIENSRPTKRIKKDILVGDPALPLRKKDDNPSKVNHHVTKENTTITSTIQKPSHPTSDKTTTTKTSTTLQHGNPNNSTSPSNTHWPQAQKISITSQSITTPSFRPSTNRILPASKVKIELVEGTTHQWRVTRLK